MFRFYAVLLLSVPVIFIYPFNASAQADGYELTGEIPGLKDGMKVSMNMMVYKPSGAEDIPADSAVVSNGQFHIKGHVPEGPRIYWLDFRNTNKFYVLYIDNGQKIRLYGNLDLTKIPHQVMNHFYTCIGSPTNDILHVVEEIDKMYGVANDLINQRQLKQIKDSIGYDWNAVSRCMQTKKQLRDVFNRIYLKRMEVDFLQGAPLLALFQSNDHNPIWKEVYDHLDDRLKNSVLGKKLKVRLPLLEGEKVPDFSLPDSTGKLITLTDLIPKGKITLVRFWATGSVIRKQLDEELRAMYRLYHDRGLNIIAVSTDSYRDQWVETLQTERYPWYNVFDKKGQQVADTAYHELGAVDHQNTTNILVDAAGRIIAWDPYGIELHYYLDAYLRDEKNKP